MEKRRYKKIYLDVCTLCRPFDNQNLMRIRLETDAFNMILEQVFFKRYDLMVSSAHIQEIMAIEDDMERKQIVSLLNEYGTTIFADLSSVLKRANLLYDSGFGTADAAHLAFAESSADCFISCDDRLLRKYSKTDIPESVKIIGLNYL